FRSRPDLVDVDTFVTEFDEVRFGLWDLRCPEFDFAGAPLAVFGVFDDGVNFKGRVVTVVIDTPVLEGGCRAQISNDHGLKDLAEELRVIREAVNTDTQGGAGQAGVSEMELRRGTQAWFRSERDAPRLQPVEDEYPGKRLEVRGDRFRVDCCGIRRHVCSECFQRCFARNIPSDGCQGPANV